MRGITSSLWPIHYKPLPDELLSCWLVRLAHGHGLKVQTFCNQIFGSRLQIWNRDIDRLAPTWLLDELSYRTGTSAEATFNTTLRAYEGLLFRKFRSSGALHWILVLKMYHRKREGHGLQFCPTCLDEDLIPYFRKQWRIAFHTVCTVHGTMLLDRCPECGAAIAVHRRDMVVQRSLEIDAIAYCHSCELDLRKAPAIEPLSYDVQASQLLMKISRDLAAEWTGDNNQWNWDRYAVMHQLSGIMVSKYKHVHLRKFVLDQIKFPDLPLRTGHISFEMRSIEERHHLMQLTAWLLVDLEARLTAGWLVGAVRYSILLKDFQEYPEWYGLIIERFANWRERSMEIKKY